MVENGAGISGTGFGIDDHALPGTPLLGLLQTQTNALLPEFAASCGYDFLVLDAQLGRFGDDAFVAGLQAIRAQPHLLAMVRLPDHGEALFERAIALGANAVLVPKVETADEARALASKGADRLFVILESVRGVANAREILAVQGVAGAVVGPVNLSADLGQPGNYKHRAFLDALHSVETAAQTTSRRLGCVPSSDLPIEALRSRGFDLFILSSDQFLLRDAMRAKAVDARAALRSDGASLSHA